MQLDESYAIAANMCLITDLSNGVNQVSAPVITSSFMMSPF